MKTSNNTILLTGGTSGIGYSILKKLNALDNKILVVGSDHQRLEKIKSEFKNIDTFCCDLSMSADVQRLIDFCYESYLDLNVVINNAGVQYNYGLGSEDDLSKIEKEVTINFTSPMKLCSGLLPLLKKQPVSAIVNVSSGLAFVPKKSAPIYCGTKAAIHLATMSLRYQCDGTSVKVFEIIPSLIDTPMTAGRGKGKISPDELVEEFLLKFKKDQHEINIGKVKVLRLLQRIAPSLANRILRDS